MKRNSKINNVRLPEVVGKGYGTFWKCKKRYRAVKGSRGSKKSTTTALWIITKMMEYPDANTMVVRKTYRTLKDSCMAQLKWAVHKLKVDSFWQFKENPLEAVFKPTGQRIYFRGLDDPLKVTSVAVDSGCLCWLWVEEAYEITKEADFDMLDESIRGAVPNGLFKQVTLTFNPWNEKHWLKARFFDKESEDTLAITTNYMCNEWLDQSDINLFENMKKNNPRRYQVAGLGNWGIVEGLIYENWEEKTFELKEMRNLKIIAGLDFGYTNDPTAMVIGFLDTNKKEFYVWDELYEKGLSNKAIYDRVCAMGYGKEKITCDSAEPKSIDELKHYGLRVQPAKKGKDSILNGVQWVQDLKIYIHPRCNNFLTEISNYTWDEDKFGNKLNVPIDDFNHLMDAMRYGLEQYIVGNGWQASSSRLM